MSLAIAVLTAASCCLAINITVSAVRVVIGAYALDPGSSTYDANAHPDNPGGAPVTIRYTEDIRMPDTSSAAGLPSDDPYWWHSFCVIKLREAVDNPPATFGDSLLTPINQSMHA